MFRSRRVQWIAFILVVVLGVATWRAASWWPRRVKLANGVIILLQNAPDGGFYAVSQDAGTNNPTLWKLNANLSVASSRSWKQPVRQAALSTDGKFLALLKGWEGAVRFYDATDGHQMKTPEGLRASNMAFSPDGRYFVICNSDPHYYGNNWTVFRRQGEKLILENHPEINVSVSQLSFSADSKTLALGGMGGDIAVVDFPSLKPRAVWPDLIDGKRSNMVSAVALTPDGKHLLSFHLGQYVVWEWNIATHSKRSQRLAYSPSDEIPNLLDYSSNGTTWVVGCSKVGNASTLQIERTLQHKSPSTAQLFAPNGDLLVGDANGTITRWKLK